MQRSIGHDEISLRQPAISTPDLQLEVNVRTAVTTDPDAGIPLHIEWNKTLCSSCMSCMVVCSERHTGTSTPSRSRIRILVGLLLDNDVTAQYCRQCADAPCAESCPEDAIAFDQESRAWIVDEEACIACGICVDACPYDAIVIDPVTDTAAKCDLCEGAVRCVEICPPKALVLVGAYPNDEADHGN